MEESARAWFTKDENLGSFLDRRDFYSNGLNVQQARVQVSPGTTTVSEDSPLSFSTVQLYVPTMSLQPTDGSIVSTVW